MTTAATTVTGSETEVILRNVRLGVFPDLFAARQFDGKGEFKYKAVLIMPADSAERKAVDAAILAAATAKWGAKADGYLKSLRGQKKEFCFLDGAMLGRPEYEGMWVLSASRRQKDGAPKVLARDKTPLTIESGKPYPGCWVHAKIAIWSQDNAFGRGMRCTLLAVQFVKDGDAFSGAGPANDVGFEEIADESDDLL